jgi:hypothetical protein
MDILTVQNDVEVMTEPNISSSFNILLVTQCLDSQTLLKEWYERQTFHLPKDGLGLYPLKISEDY